MLLLSSLGEELDSAREIYESNFFNGAIWPSYSYVNYRGLISDQRRVTPIMCNGGRNLRKRKIKHCHGFQGLRFLTFRHAADSKYFLFFSHKLMLLVQTNYHRCLSGTKIIKFIFDRNNTSTHNWEITGQTDFGSFAALKRSVLLGILSLPSGCSGKCGTD